MIPVGWTSSVFDGQEHSPAPAMEFVLIKHPACVCVREHLWNTSIKQSELGREGEVEDL